MSATRSRRSLNRRPGLLVRLWLLRILNNAGAHRKFIHAHAFDSDEVARALGLACTPAHDPVKIRQRLLAMQTLAERDVGRLRPPGVMPGNLARLSEALGLDDVDQTLLAFVCLVHAEPALSEAVDLLGTLHTADTFRTLGRILDLPARAIAAALQPQGLLSSTGLVQLRRHSGFPLRHKLEPLSETFADLITTARVAPDQLLRGVIAQAPAPELALSDYPHLDTSLEILLRYLERSLADGRQGVNVLLHGPPGTGKTQLTRVLATRSKCLLFEVSSEDEDGDPVGGERRLRALSAAQALLARRRALLLFDEAEDVFNDGNDPFGRRSTAQTRKAWMNRRLENARIPTFWLTNSIDAMDPAFIRRFDMIIELPVPPRSQRQRIIQRACKGLIGETCIARLAEPEGLAPAVVSRAAAVIRSIRAELDQPQAERAIEHLIDSTLQAQGFAPMRQSQSANLPAGYDTAFLNPDSDITAVADGLRQSGQGRICLYGPPGTGKTAFARWLAHRLDLPLHVKRASDLLSQWVGGTEKQLARAFRAAEQDRALLLIDEVDSFLRDRSDAHQHWEATQVNEMLTCMESFAGIFIASTNRMDGLDAAALRRFDARIHFGFLRPEQVRAMLHAHCKLLGLPAPGAAEERAVAGLHALAPGDFAALARQHRFRPIGSPARLVELLQAECAQKRGAQRPIGFVR